MAAEDAGTAAGGGCVPAQGGEGGGAGDGARVGASPAVPSGAATAARDAQSHQPAWPGKGFPELWFLGRRGRIRPRDPSTESCPSPTS